MRGNRTVIQTTDAHATPRVSAAEAQVPQQNSTPHAPFATTRNPSPTLQVLVIVIPPSVAVAITMME
jgi:hypothetical protein